MSLKGIKQNQPKQNQTMQEKAKAKDPLIKNNSVERWITISPVTTNKSLDLSRLSDDDG